ncbi:MAG: M1 family metallopeptidase, partial [bacterium]
MRGYATILILLVLSAQAAMPTHAAAQEGTGYEILYGSKRGVPEIDRQTGSLATPYARSSTEVTGFDVLGYVLDITIDPTAKTVAGTVDVKFAVAAAQLDSFVLYLKDNMIVTAVEMESAPLPFARVSDRIHIDLPGVYTWGDTLTVRVAYNGAPVQPLGLRFHSRVVYNLSEPDMARNWFPCYDEPWDKATSEMICTVPADRFCASNGLLISETDNLDGTKTYHWKTRYPHSTYLTSVAISDYVMLSQWYHYSPSDSMEMPYYVYPDKLPAAQTSFANAPAMMAFFSATFGEYPFVEEKYGTALAEVGGAMENLTCTTYGQVLVTGDNRYDWVVAHEMAHSWFGNSVTLADWREVWLNEGFATYGDALWHEHTGGPAAFESRMENFKSQYFTEDAGNRFPMYDPAIMWGATVYEKGAWVLHMLRYVVGDTAFFTGLRTYYQLHAYSTATTEQLRTVFEAVSGMDLQWFFDQWVYEQGSQLFGRRRRVGVQLVVSSESGEK